MNVGSIPALSTILEPVLISFALGAAVCWFEPSLPEHYRGVGKLVKPAIISQVKIKNIITNLLNCQEKRR